MKSLNFVIGAVLAFVCWIPISFIMLVLEHEQTQEILKKECFVEGNHADI